MGNTIELAKADKRLVDSLKMWDYLLEFRAQSYGRVWVAKAAPIVAGFRAIASGGGVLVAVADTGSGNRIIRSTDYGKTFVEVDLTGSYSLTDIAFGGGVFVAVGTGLCVRSTDLGVTWEAVASGTGPFIDWDGSRFITSTSGLNPPVLRRSSDLGETFEVVTHNVGWSTGGRLKYNNGKYLMTPVGMGNVAASNDMENWTEISSIANVNDVAYVNGRYVISRNGAAGFYYSDDDGQNWNEVEMPSANYGFLEHKNGVFITHILNSTSFFMSVDGTIWRDIVLPEVAQIESVASIGGRLVGVSYTGTNRVFISDV